MVTPVFVTLFCLLLTHAHAVFPFFFTFALCGTLGMTCPLDPEKYPVLLDSGCEVKVLLGKDQHTSVSTRRTNNTGRLFKDRRKKGKTKRKVGCVSWETGFGLRPSPWPIPSWTSELVPSPPSSILPRGSVRRDKNQHCIAKNTWPKPTFLRVLEVRPDTLP